jgi:circadian clock protein KaiB
MGATEARSSVAKSSEKPPELRLRLYVSGNAPNSARAIANIRAICDEHFASGHDLEIVDLLEHPTRALVDNIIVTPTLVKLLPLPVQRVIGSLSDTTELLVALSSE